MKIMKFLCLTLPEKVPCTPGSEPLIQGNSFEIKAISLVLLGPES